MTKCNVERVWGGFGSVDLHIDEHHLSTHSSVNRITQGPRAAIWGAALSFLSGVFDPQNWQSGGSSHKSYCQCSGCIKKKMCGRFIKMLIRANRGKKFSEDVGRWSGSVLQVWFQSACEQKEKEKKHPANTYLKKNWQQLLCLGKYLIFWQWLLFSSIMKADRIWNARTFENWLWIGNFVASKIYK